MRPSSLYQIQTWDWNPRLPQETLYRLEKNCLRNIWQVDTDFFLGSKKVHVPAPSNFLKVLMVYFLSMLYETTEWTQECIPVGCVPPACWPYPSMHWAVVGCLPGGGLCPGDVWSGGCMLRGVGVYPRGGCLSGGGCLPRGVLQTPPRTETDTPPCEQNDWQTGVKTLPCRNFVADGNKKDWNQLQMRQASLLKTLPNNSIINLFFSKSKSMRNSQHKH